MGVLRIHPHKLIDICFNIYNYRGRVAQVLLLFAFKKRTYIQAEKLENNNFHFNSGSYLLNKGSVRGGTSLGNILLLALLRHQVRDAIQYIRWERIPY